MNDLSSLVCERFKYSTRKKEINFFLVSRMSGLDPEFGIKMMEIRVAEMNATLNEQRGNERSQKLTRV